MHCTHRKWGMLLAFALAAGASIGTALSSSARAEVKIETDVYEGRPHFRVCTATATYWVDRQAGAFSRLIDKEGSDWIAFRKAPLSQFPASAAAGYRGLPNLVFGKDNPDAGVGHPGFDLCETDRIGDAALRTTSRSGRWVWTWTFTDEHASLEVLRADPGHSYWFLYEGPIAGKWSPGTHYFGTPAAGPRRERPTSKTQLFERFPWIYFGDDNSPRVLLIQHLTPDDLDDTVWYLGNTSAGLESPDGMVVFGFGRGPKPLLRGAGQRFRIRFVEQPVANAADHARLSALLAQ